MVRGTLSYTVGRMQTLQTFASVLLRSTTTSQRSATSSPMAPNETTPAATLGAWRGLLAP